MYCHKGEKDKAVERVIIRTADFVTAPKMRKQLKVYLESPDRQDPDLTKRLPEIITRFRPEQLCVRSNDADVFSRVIEPIPQIDVAPKHTFVDLLAGCGRTFIWP